MLIVNPWHWLDGDGMIMPEPRALRRNIIRVARLIEYGGPLPARTGRETLEPCDRRPGRQLCRGFLWVTKLPNDNLLAFCPVCHTDQVYIENWQDTLWSEGPMDPQPMQPVADG
jgi:hypothetical protein